jgi:hypothetical protein
VRCHESRTTVAVLSRSTRPIGITATSRRTSNTSGSFRPLHWVRLDYLQNRSGPVRPSVQIQAGPAARWVRAQSNTFASDSGLIVLCRLSSWARNCRRHSDAAATQHLLCATASLRCFVALMLSSRPRRRRMTPRGRVMLAATQQASHSLSARRADALMMTA